MSCDWDLICLDCKDQHGFNDLNHWDTQLIELAKQAPEIAKFSAIRDKLSTAGCYNLEMSLAYNRAFIRFSWFVLHENHKIVPVSEYGEIILPDGTRDLLSRH